MEESEKIEVIIKGVGSVLTFVTVIVGVWQFNRGQKELKEKEIAQRNFELEKMKKEATIETRSKFKEIQIQKYVEATSVIGFLSVNENFESQEYKARLEKFWQLYWVELSSVESKEVEISMVKFGDLLKKMAEANYINFKELQQALKIASYNVAQAIKESSKTWELPAGF